MPDTTLTARSALGRQGSAWSGAGDGARDGNGQQPEISPGAGSTEQSGYRQSIGGITLSECGPTALVSIAFRAARADQVASALKSACRLDWPGIGHSTVGARDTRLIALQTDQYWLVWPTKQPAADLLARQWLGDVPVCLTDQSDGWACLEMQGESCAAVLERLCCVDLNDTQCPTNAALRTTMEHTGTILIRVSAQCFRFITPRSSVQSFCHALQSVAWHVHNEHRLRNIHTTGPTSQVGEQGQ